MNYQDSLYIKLTCIWLLHFWLPILVDMRRCTYNIYAVMCHVCIFTQSLIFHIFKGLANQITCKKLVIMELSNEASLLVQSYGFALIMRQIFIINLLCLDAYLRHCVTRSQWNTRLNVHRFAYSLYRGTWSVVLKYVVTHWSQETHICVSKLTIIGSDNALSPGRRRAIIWTNAGISLIRIFGTKLQWKFKRN